MNKYDCAVRYTVILIKTIEAESATEAEDAIQAAIVASVKEAHGKNGIIKGSNIGIYPHNPESIELELQFIEDKKKSGFSITSQEQRPYE